MRKRWVSRDNGNVHRAAANIIVSKSRAARGSVCNVLLSRDCWPNDPVYDIAERPAFQVCRVNPLYAGIIQNHV